MAGRNRPHVLSLQDPQPPILGRAPLPPPRPGLIDDPRLLPPTHQLHRGGPHPILILEERLAAQQREIHELLFDNQRLAATHVALKQEVDVVQHELHIAGTTASKANAERDAEVRELYERALRLEGEARLVERMREELAHVRSDIRELAAAREELADRLQGMKAELGRARAEVQQVPAIRAEIDTMQMELQKGRAAVEYEKRAHAANLEQSQAMEKNMISMAREVEKLQDELADAEKRARAAAAASMANPGGGYGGGFGSHEMSYVGASYANVYNAQQMPHQITARLPRSSKESEIPLILDKGKRPLEIPNDNPEPNPKKSMAIDECEEQRKVTVDCFQTLTFREASRDRSPLSIHKGITINDFLKLNPDTFHGDDMGEVIDKAAAWVLSMEYTFTVLKCPEENKVLYATYQLKGLAKLWWDNYSHSHPLEVPLMSWECFKVIFSERFMPVTQKKEKEKQFNSLTQSNLYVADYAREFRLPERHAYMLTEERRVDHLIDGLNYKIRPLVMSSNPSTIDKTLNPALKLERDMGLPKPTGLEYLGLTHLSPTLEKCKNEKKANSHGKGGEKGDSCKGKSFKDEGEDKVKCRNCGRYHWGKCKYEKPVCYLCKQEGHYKSNCPSAQMASLESK